MSIYLHPAVLIEQWLKKKIAYKIFFRYGNQYSSLPGSWQPVSHKLVDSRHPEHSGDGNRELLCLMSYFSILSTAPVTVMGITQGQGGEEVLQSTTARKELRILQFLLKLMKKCMTADTTLERRWKKGPTRISVIWVQQLAPETEGFPIPALRPLGVCH